MMWHRFLTGGAQGGVRDYGDVTAEHAAINNAAGLWHHGHGGLVEVGGKDRVGWLQNLLTQDIKNVSPGDGHYAFAVNVKGRIVFDLHVWMDREAIWLDLDRRTLDDALSHLNKFIITEDVTLADRSEEFVRLVLLGPKGGAILSEFGATHASAMAHFQHMPIDIAGASVRLLRQSELGPCGWALNLPSESATTVRSELLRVGEAHGLIPVGLDAVNIQRIEAGVPWSMNEIDNTVLPAETGQFDRAVSFNKGCYLGQEIVERMRTRGSVARALVGLRLDSPDGAEGFTEGAPLGHDGRTVGIITSTCQSLSLGSWIGLAYVRQAQSDVGVELTIESSTPSATVTVCELPFR